MNENWTSIRVLQYLLFKGDRLNERAKEVTSKIKISKKLTDDEFIEYFRALLYLEFFDEVFNELIKYL